jgi:hypothetical protein
VFQVRLREGSMTDLTEWPVYILTRHIPCDACAQLHEPDPHCLNCEGTGTYEHDQSFVGPLGVLRYVEAAQADGQDPYPRLDDSDWFDLARTGHHIAICRVQQKHGVAVGFLLAKGAAA